MMNRNPDSSPPGTRPILQIDLGALEANYRRLKDKAAPASVACVVKANAYGLGYKHVSAVLNRAGCRNFFVATVEEALALKSFLPRAGVAFLAGPLAADVDILLRHGLVPVLNSPDQIALMAQTAAKLGKRLPVFIHLDTGMNRLGLSRAEQNALAENHNSIAGLDVRCWVSHLACADDLQHPMNMLQLRRFQDITHRLPKAKCVFANSGGIYLGPEYHLDIVKPGISLYGGRPHAGAPNPMLPVAHLAAPVLQLRQAEKGDSVGYGATHFCTRPARIATVLLGYADGFHRAGSGKSHLYFDGAPCPVLGRVSMDLITVDISAVPEGHIRPGTPLEVLGEHQDIDALAESWGTISYEVITSLGARYERRYVNGGRKADTADVAA